MAGEGKKPEATALVEAVVAKGRTIQDVAGTVGPGGKIALSADEAAELTKRGFLVDPTAKVGRSVGGLAFTSETGPTVQASA